MSRKLKPVSQRIVVNPMEPRAALAEFRDGRYTLTVCSQGVFGLKQSLANDILKVPPAQVRVITGNVGGSFGMKIAAYPGIYLRALRREGTGPAGEMDRRALGLVRLRQSRPRP